MKRLLILLLVAVVGSFALAQEDGGVLEVATVSEPTSLDPITTNNVPSRLVLMQIHDSLVAYDENLNVVPKLASGWEVSEDGTEYTFTLREGITFHNGDPLTAEDVKYTFDAALNPDLQGQWLGILAGVEGVEVVNDLTVVVRLAAADASFIDQIVYLGIANSRVHQEIGAAEYAINPVGTGPFKFVSWQRNDALVLERNEDYWLKRPHLDGVEFRAIPERSVAAVELESGGVDAAMQLSAEDLLRLQDHSDITIDTTPTLSYYYLALNNQQGPLADVRVRKAIQMAIPMDQLVETIFQGVGAVRAYSSFAPNSLAHDPQLVESYPEYNPEAARQLLAEAGHPDGFSTTLYTPTDSNRRQLGELTQAALAQVGIQVEVRSVEFGTLLPLTYSGEAPMWILGWTNGVDPNNYLYDMFHSDSAAWEENAVTFNSVRYDNPQVDGWLEEARTLNDMDERLDIYREAARVIFLEDVAHIPAYHQTSTLAFNNNVQDIFADPNSGIELVSTYNNVWIEQ